MERIETLRQRWEDYRPTKAQAFWIAAAGIAATLIIGFGFAGWVTGGTVQKQVAEAAANARHELAAAVCVEDFMAHKDAGQILAKLKDAGWWERSELLAKGGWATMPDRKEPNSVVATMCAGKLSEMQPPAAATPVGATLK
jgi:hypothetical protein